MFQQINLNDGGVSLKYTNVSLYDLLQTGDGTNGYWSNSTNELGYFAVKYLIEGHNYAQGYLQRGDVIKIYLELPGGLAADKEAKISFMSSAGGITPKTYLTPSSIIGTRDLSS